MEIDLGVIVLQLSATQVLGLFWAAAVAIAFNGAYYLFIKDRGPACITKARMGFTMLVGTLIVVGTYADTLAAQEVFRMKDCLLLALVAAHGWTAEELVQSIRNRSAGSPPGI